MLIDEQAPGITEGYDLIGDIHGCADTLKTLLFALGYRQKGDAFLYPDEKRKLIFLGDFIDRGPKIPETLRMVRATVEQAGALAVLGNHEFNAIAFFTRVNQGYLRHRNERAKQQIGQTLNQFSGDMDSLLDYIEWFKTLPLFLDLGAFRVIHACWDQEKVDEYYRRFQTHRFCEQALSACVQKDRDVVRILNRLMSGVNLTYPDGLTVEGRDGFLRSSFRAKFWLEKPETYEDVVFQPDPLPESVARKPLSSADEKKLIYYSDKEKPLFIGHYWLNRGERISPVACNVACLDYSAVTGGQLVAYRFMEGDSSIHGNQFVAVDYCDSA